MSITKEQHRVGISSGASFVRNSSLFSASLVLGGCCRIIRTIVVAKLLGPQGFGTWRFVNIFSDYIHFASLGTQPAMNRRVPFLRGKGDVERIEVVLRTVCATTFFFSIIYSFVVFGWSFVVTDTANAKALVAFSPVILLLAWMRYAQEFAMATASYGLRNRLEIFDAFSSTLLCVVLVYLWGIYGAMAGLGISALMAVCISARKLWQYFSLRIQWHILHDLIVTGLPILADIILLITIVNADKILIAAMLDMEILGIYSVGYAAVGILGLFPSALGQMMFVKFAEMDGQSKSKRHVSDVLDRSTVIVSSAFAPMLCVAIAGFPIAVVLLLPQYVGGIGAGKILIAGVFFLGISLPVTKWCISTGQFVSVLGLRVVVVVAEFVAVYLVIRNGARLEFIALCVFFAFTIYSIAIIISCNRLLEESPSMGIVRAGKSALPFISVLSALWVQGIVYPVSTYVPGMELFVSCILSLIVGLAVSVPFLFWANRRTRIVDLMFGNSDMWAVGEVKQ